MKIFTLLKSSFDTEQSVALHVINICKVKFFVGLAQIHKYTNNSFHAKLSFQTLTTASSAICACSRTRRSVSEASFE